MQKISLYSSPSLFFRLLEMGNGETQWAHTNRPILVF